MIAALAIAAACSSVSIAPGAGDSDTICLGEDGCVTSCASQINNPAGFCDEHGQFQCPAGAIKLSTCPEDACAHPRFCCDPTSGEIAIPSCGADGVHAACPAGTRAAALPVCIPDGATVSKCEDLHDQPCTSAGQQCHSGGAECTCQAGDAGLAWACSVNIL